MFIIIFPVLINDRRIAFRNLSGSVDIRIVVNCKKDHVIANIREKLNDQSITDIINYDVTRSDDIYAYNNIIIRNTNRVELLNNLGITAARGPIQPVNIYTVEELRKILLEESNQILLNDFEFIKTVLQCGDKYHAIYPIISDRLKDEISLIGEVIKNCEYIEYASYRIRSDYHEISYLLNRCYTETCKAERKRTNTIIRSDIIYNSLSDDLKCNTDMIRNIFKHNLRRNEIARKIPTCILENRDILLSDLASCLHFIYPSLNNLLKHDKDILNMVITSNHSLTKNEQYGVSDTYNLYRYIPSDILNNKDYMTSVIHLVGFGVFKHVSYNLRNDSEFVLDILKMHLYDAPSEYMYDDDIFPYISDSLRDDKEFVLNVIEIDICFDLFIRFDFFRYASSNLKNDKEFVLDIMNQYGYVDIYKYLHYNLKSNLDIIVAILKSDNPERRNIYNHLQCRKLSDQDQIKLFNIDEKIFKHLSHHVNTLILNNLIKS